MSDTHLPFGKPKSNSRLPAQEIIPGVHHLPMGDYVITDWWRAAVRHYYEKVVEMDYALVAEQIGCSETTIQKILSIRGQHKTKPVRRSEHVERLAERPGDGNAADGGF